MIELNVSINVEPDWRNGNDVAGVAEGMAWFDV